MENDTCIPLFIAALFIIARTWKQCRCPSIDEWIKKLWYTYTTEYCSTIKRDACQSGMRRMAIDPARQSEVSQREKSKYHMLTYTHTHTHRN